MAHFHHRVRVTCISTSHSEPSKQAWRDSIAAVSHVFTKTVTFIHSAPWFNAELQQLEWLHKKTGLTVHALAYKEHMHI